MRIDAGDGEELLSENHAASVRLNTRDRQMFCGLLSATTRRPSAGILPHMKKPATGKAILRRIDKRLAALKAGGVKLTDRALSLKATDSPDTLRSIRRNITEGKQRGISTETLAKFAPILHTTVEWLLSESGPESPTADEHIESTAVLGDQPPPGRRIRIVGYVGAGSVAHYYALSDEDYEEVLAPENASDQTVAVEIKGKSFGPLMDGWLVFYDDVRSPVGPELYGEICVVGLADDRILIKQIKPERNGSLTLLSNSNEPPILDAQVEWAARVTTMRRR